MLRILVGKLLVVMNQWREKERAMRHVIVIRGYKPTDEPYCKELIRRSVMSPLNATFVGIIFKEITFQLMILFAAIMFIFFGLPFTVCLLVVPTVFVCVYIGTYMAFAAKVMQVNEEVSNISRSYMSNAFSCFWVAEAFEPHLTTVRPKEAHYTIVTEEQFKGLNIDVSCRVKKIVGTIGLSKSHRSDKGAWIKRLCVHESYRRKGIGSCLLNVALQFAIDQGYSCANVVASEYTDNGRELCLKKGFELKQMYHKPIIGFFVTILMYELTYQIKPGDDDYVSHYYDR